MARIFGVVFSGFAVKAAAIAAALWIASTAAAYVSDVFSADSAVSSAFANVR